MKDMTSRISELRNNFETCDKKYIKKLMIEKILQYDPFCRIIPSEISISNTQDYSAYLQSIKPIEVLDAFITYWSYIGTKDFDNMLYPIEENILS